MTSLLRTSGSQCANPGKAFDQRCVVRPRFRRLEHMRRKEVAGMKTLVVMMIIETLYYSSLVLSVLAYLQGKPLDSLVYLALFVVAAEFLASQERSVK